MNGFAPACDDHILRTYFDPARCAHVARNRLAQLDDAGRWRVAVLALAYRLDRGVLDILGRMEIGLADAKRDHVLALPDQGIDLREHDEGVFGAELTSAAADVWHGCFLAA
jgi:hypothetical protein